MENLTADACEEIFHAALSAGDARGVEAALRLLAVRDPHRAQRLLTEAKATVHLAGELREADDPTLSEAIADGDARYLALVDAYRQAKAAAGFGPAATDLLSALINDTDPSMVVAMLAASVIREGAREPGTTGS